MTKLVVDWTALDENFDSDKFAISLVVEAFVEALPDSMATLRSALNSKDGKAVAMAAHSLKGAILNFGAADAVKFSQALENLGYEGLTAEAEVLFKELEEAVSVILAELEAEAARYQEAG